MATATFQAPAGSYDSRWFIWTIVFLVVTGISLVSYIVLSDTNASDASLYIPVARAMGHKPGR